MKRRKLLQIRIGNPDHKLYCLALIIANEQANRGVNLASEIYRNVACYMEEQDPDTFVESCLSYSGFGVHDTVDLAGKLGHLERLCEAASVKLGFDLPDYQAVSGYAPVAAVHRKLRR